MRPIWRLRTAIKTIHNDWEFYGIGAIHEYYSSLTKCRDYVKAAFESGEVSSHKKWFEEVWAKDGKECFIINSGGNGMFCFQRVEVK